MTALPCRAGIVSQAMSAIEVEHFVDEGFFDA